MMTRDKVLGYNDRSEINLVSIDLPSPKLSKKERKEQKEAIEKMAKALVVCCLGCLKAMRWIANESIQLIEKKQRVSK